MELVDRTESELSQLTRQVSTELTRGGLRLSLRVAANSTNRTLKAVTALQRAARAQRRQRNETGRVSLTTFARIAQGRSILEIEDRAVARELSRELQRLGVLFTDERTRSGDHVFHVQGKDAEVIEHALRVASTRLDERLTGGIIDVASGDTPHVEEEPTLEEPAREEPAREEPAREEPAREEPAREEPAIEEEPTLQERLDELDLQIQAAYEESDFDLVDLLENQHSTLRTAAAYPAADVAHEPEVLESPHAATSPHAPQEDELTALDERIAEAWNAGDDDLGHALEEQLSELQRASETTTPLEEASTATDTPTRAVDDGDTRPVATEAQRREFQSQARQADFMLEIEAVAHEAQQLGVDPGAYRQGIQDRQLQDLVADYLQDREGYASASITSELWKDWRAEQALRQLKLPSTELQPRSAEAMTVVVSAGARAVAASEAMAVGVNERTYLAHLEDEQIRQLGRLSRAGDAAEPYDGLPRLREARIDYVRASIEAGREARTVIVAATPVTPGHTPTAPSSTPSPLDQQVTHLGQPAAPSELHNPYLDQPVDHALAPNTGEATMDRRDATRARVAARIDAAVATSAGDVTNPARTPHLAIGADADPKGARR